MLTLTADSMALRHQNCLGISFLRQRGRYFVSVKNSDFAQKSNEESSKPSAPCPNWTRKPGKTNTVKFRKQAPGLIFFKCTVFALFYFVYEGNFQVQAPVGLKCGGAYMYIWRGLFSEFYGAWLRTPKCTSTLLHGSKTWTTYTRQYRRFFGANKWQRPYHQKWSTCMCWYPQYTPPLQLWPPEKTRPGLSHGWWTRPKEVLYGL